jgi:hypothetical protein
LTTNLSKENTVTTDGGHGNGPVVSFLTVALGNHYTLRQNPNFSQQFQPDFPCPALRAKIFLFHFSEIHVSLSPIPIPLEGRFAVVMNVGIGMRWP